MRKKNKDESLTRKVLLSIMAAGVMSGFVFQAEAADSLIVDGNPTIVKTNETFTKVGANGGANITLNGGQITGSKEKHTDDEEPAIIAADVAAEIDSGSVLTANNVDFTGEIAAHDGGKIVLNDGSVKSGSFYTAQGRQDGYNTEVGVNDKGSSIEFHKVKIDSNLGAFDGGVITTYDSDVNADTSIYTEGQNARISLNSASGSNTYTVGEDGIEAADGSTIDINGGKVKTSYLVANDNTKITADKADINATEGIWASGKNAIVILNGTEKTVYTAGKGLIAEKGGKIYIHGGTLADNELRTKMYKVQDAEDKKIIYNTDTKGIVLDNNGIISTMSNQIYAKSASATEKESGAITNEGIDFKGGGLVLNDAKYTQSYANAAQAELQKQGATKLTMKGDLVKDNTGEIQTEIPVSEAAEKFGSRIELDKVTAEADSNLIVGSKILPTQSIEGIDVKTQVANGFSVGKLNLGAGSKGVIITNDQEVTLGGSKGGNIITVADTDSKVKVIVGTDQAGTEKITGKLNIGNSLANERTPYYLNGEVIVNKDSQLNISGQTSVTDGMTLNDGTLQVKKGALKTQALNVNGKAKLTGTVNTETLTAKDKTVLTIGDKDSDGTLIVNKAELNGGMLFLDPVWKGNDLISNASGLAIKNSAALDGAYVAGQNSKISFGADLTAADNAFKRSREKWGADGITAAAYIASPVDVTKGSIMVDGSQTTAPGVLSAGSVKFADKSLLMVDASAVMGNKAAITGVKSANVADASKLYLDNAKKGETYKILAGSTQGWKAENIISNNKLLTFEIKAATGNEYDVITDSKSVKDAYGDQLIAGDVYDAALATGGVATDFVNRASDDHYNADDAAKISALNSAVALNELAGVEHGAYAVNNLFTNAIADHMSLANERTHDKDIWAKYIHSKENIDGLAIAGMGGQYDSTYNGVIVGADLYKKGKAVIGAAFSYVDGDTDGNTIAARTENDAKYYGGSIYGGIQDNTSLLMGDISYLHGKNDIDQYNSGMDLTADVKTDVFSLGIRAEKSLRAGIGKFVPYTGIRYMHLSTGDYTNSLGMHYNTDDINLWLLPVGIKYSADVKNGNWTIRPLAEVGYIWNLGDRDSTQTVSINGISNGFCYDVTDTGSYIARLAVEAEKGSITYGLGYGYQKGDSVKDNQWMASVNWKF